MQGELSMVQNQLINSRFAFANVLQSTQQHHQQQHQQPNYINVALQPAYSNNSSASTNLMNMSSFNNPGFDLAMEAAPSPHSFEPLQFSRLSQDEENDEEESRIPQVFNHEIVLHRQ